MRAAPWPEPPWTETSQRHRQYIQVLEVAECVFRAGPGFTVSMRWTGLIWMRLDCFGSGVSPTATSSTSDLLPAHALTAAAASLYGVESDAASYVRGQEE